VHCVGCVVMSNDYNTSNEKIARYVEFMNIP